MEEAAAASMQLDVIGAGLGRTGTMTLQQSLQILGLGPCYHMIEVLPNRDADKWLAVESARRRRDAGAMTAAFDALFASPRGRYRSAVDHPAATYYAELLQRNPSAKVVLTVRDSADAWWRSFHATIGRPSDGALQPLALKALPEYAKFKRTTAATVFDQPNMFRGLKHDESFCKAFYHEWIDRVKASVPEGRLLVWNVKQGWAPLCTFLGVPEPGVPLPHANDTAAFQAMVARMKRKFLCTRLLPAVLALAAAPYCVWLLLHGLWP